MVNWPNHSAIYCPELNMLKLWSRSGEGESFRVRQLTSLLIGEPNVAFAPPEGSIVQRLEAPAGPGCCRPTRSISCGTEPVARIRTQLGAMWRGPAGDTHARTISSGLHNEPTLSVLIAEQS
jgi:hypothetical protein